MDGMVDIDTIRSQMVIDTAGLVGEGDLSGDALILAADRGDPQAQTEVAVLLLQVEQYDAAVYWLQKASARNPEAMHQLARCYLDGKGVPEDIHLGMMWLHKAAASGHEIAKAQAAGVMIAAASRVK